MNLFQKYYLQTCFYLLFLFIVVTYISSQTEKYDPMARYKKQNVQTSGPKEEKVIDVHNNQVIASAKYFYNKKYQLIRAQYYLGNKQDGWTTYKYSRKGFYEEVSFNNKNQVVEKIRYQLNQRDNISSYHVLDEKIEWKFVYKNGELRLGKRYSKKKLTEYFVFTKKTNDYRLQSLFSEDNKRVGLIEYFYKNARLIKRIKKDSIGVKKAEHHYTQDGRLQEIVLFKVDTKNNYQLNKKRIFKYSSTLTDLSQK